MISRSWIRLTTFCYCHNADSVYTSFQSDRECYLVLCLSPISSALGITLLVEEVALISGSVSQKNHLSISQQSSIGLLGNHGRTKVALKVLRIVSSLSNLARVQKVLIM